MLLPGACADVWRLTIITQTNCVDNSGLPISTNKVCADTVGLKCITEITFFDKSRLTMFIIKEGKSSDNTGVSILLMRACADNLELTDITQGEFYDNSRLPTFTLRAHTDNSRLTNINSRLPNLINSRLTNVAGSNFSVNSRLRFHTCARVDKPRRVHITTGICFDNSWLSMLIMSARVNNWRLINKSAPICVGASVYKSQKPSNIMFDPAEAAQQISAICAAHARRNTGLNRSIGHRLRRNLLRRPRVVCNERVHKV